MAATVQPVSVMTGWYGDRSIGVGNRQTFRLRRVTAAAPAYQQLADELRELILAGSLAPGDRLAGEEDLGDRYGVSRSTAREAIRLLEAQHLVVTTRGTTGGSFVARQAPDRIDVELGASIGLLVAQDHLLPEQIIEARGLLEVPAAALAARRRTEEHLEALRQCVAAGRDGNERFHQVLLQASGNPLVEAMTRPLLRVLRDRARDRAPEPFWAEVDDDHARILALVEAGDADGAAEAVREHLDNLGAMYHHLEHSDH